MASLEGSPVEVEAFLTELQLPASADLLGPVPVSDEVERMLVRVPRSRGAELATVLQAVTRTRSVKKEPVVRVRLDPAQIG